MAYAFARLLDVGISSEGSLQMTLQVTYTGADIPGGNDSGQVTGVVAGDAQPAAIRTLMSNAVAADAQARGYTVAGTNMILPTYQKG